MRDGGDLDGRLSCGASTTGVPPPPLAAFHTPTNLTHRGGAAGEFGAGSSQPDGGAAAAWGYGNVEERLAWAGNLKAARRVEKLAEGRAVLAPFYRRC